MVISTPIAIKNMDCSTCKAFEPTGDMNGVHSGVCHRHAPVIVPDKDLLGRFPIIYLPDWCMEYIAKDMATKMPSNLLAPLPAWH